MKASEWADAFRRLPRGDALRNFVREIESTAWARGAGPAAVGGAVREGEQRFRAVLARAPDLGLGLADFDAALAEWLTGAFLRLLQDARSAAYLRHARRRAAEDCRAACRAADALPDPLARLAVRASALLEKQDRVREAEELVRTPHPHTGG